MNSAHEAVCHQMSAVLDDRPLLWSGSEPMEWLWVGVWTMVVGFEKAIASLPYAGIGQHGVSPEWHLLGIFLLWGIGKLKRRNHR